MNRTHDAVVVGSGPNGFAAAITLASHGLSTLLLEAEATLGGGARSAELTLPGFLHDVCSAVHPLAVASPFFRSLPLDRHGLEWIYPPLPVAHPLHNGESAAMRPSVEITSKDMGADAQAYARLFSRLVQNWDKLLDDVLQPMLHLPRHPVLLARFGLRAILPAKRLAESLFKEEKAKALFAGLAMHSVQPLEAPASAAIALVLGLIGHALGWPIPKGGAQRITNALESFYRSLGGDVATGTRIGNLRELPSARIIMLDVTPKQFLRLAEDRLPGRYATRLERFRYGPGIFKIDYALNSPIPWGAPDCRNAATVHVGGPEEQIAQSARDVYQGRHPDRPFVLLAQPTLFDPSRAPDGKHIAWAYCHVPNRSTYDMTGRMENQIERFAPGFRDCIIAKQISMTPDLEQHNANLVGGSIDGGSQSLAQMLARPVFSASPYRTPVRGVYLCSSSTPPGGGVHGMCGYNAAMLALKDFNISEPQERLE